MCGRERTKKKRRQASRVGGAGGKESRGEKGKKERRNKKERKRNLCGDAIDSSRVQAAAASAQTSVAAIPLTHGISKKKQQAQMDVSKIVKVR